jgi:hypothetical protein
MLDGSQADTYSEQDSRASEFNRDSQQKHAPMLSPKSVDEENPLGHEDERAYDEGESLHSENKIEFDYIEKTDEDIYVDTLTGYNKHGESHRTMHRALSNLSYNSQDPRGESEKVPAGQKEFF